MAQENISTYFSPFDIRLCTMEIKSREFQLYAKNCVQNLNRLNYSQFSCGANPCISLKLSENAKSQ
uniref:Uncharacterized protein n=1 Tax=Anguilla anguilla TaxID=7936 RepID=A0A0E9WGX3_ANGAN